GREEERIREEIEGEEEEKRSRDNRIKGRGKLVEYIFIREREWSILNGKGDSVIDYVLVDEETREEIEYMEMGDAIDTDHHPLVVAWKRGREKGNGKGKEGRGASRGILDEEGRVVFRELLGGVEWWEGKGEECMKETEGRIREILENIEKERGKEKKGRGWWESREKKEGVRRVLREWRKGEYRKEKREYKELCEVKKKEENERWERKVEGARSERQIDGERRGGGKYGGWKERQEVERLQERYQGWVLGVERRTLGYMVREELQREKLRVRAGKMAWAFEERLRGGGGIGLAQLCWEEVRGNIRWGEKLKGWEKEKGQFFEVRGGGIREIA
ncbi:hypothetical protein ALC57_01193, partial [Trachymyrmex cornetzi]